MTSLVDAADSSFAKGAYSCSELTGQARAMLQAAVFSADQCETAADCRYVEHSASCVDCFHIVGVKTQAALMANAVKVTAICDEFKRLGCQLIPSGCPPPADPKEFVCEQGRCTLPGGR